MRVGFRQELGGHSGGAWLMSSLDYRCRSQGAGRDPSPRQGRGDRGGGGGRRFLLHSEYSSTKVCQWTGEQAKGRGFHTVCNAGSRETAPKSLASGPH